MSNPVGTPPPETVAAVARAEAKWHAEHMAATILDEALIENGYAPTRCDNAVTFTYTNGWGLERTIRLTVTAEVIR